MAKNAPAVRVLFPEDLEEFMEKRGEGAYLLLDVRQPEEYEESHLPGSKLVSLPELPGSISRLDPEKETVVYCAMGGRSRIAANFLAVRGFQSVFQLQGGIEAWEKKTATGPAGFHLQFIRGDESPEEAARMAYRMEEGLEQFHRTALEKSAKPEVRDILLKLAKAEESHKGRLLELLAGLGPGTAPGPISPPLAGGVGGGEASRMEGGLDIDQFLLQNAPYLETVRGCLELAMMIEVQALDLYLRMAQTCSHPGAREVFFGLGDEEKSHLRALGDLMGRLAGE